MSTPRPVPMPLIAGSAAELTPAGYTEAIPKLAELLVDAVDSGASVGFISPFTVMEATVWWHGLLPDVEAGRTIVLVARDRERHIVGTAQLALSQMPNSRHRATVAKVLVHRDARRRGVGRLLMTALEDAARRRGRTLLILDTITDSDAVRLYERMGWTRAGEIPRYAAMPDGTLAPTTYFFKELK